MLFHDVWHIYVWRCAPELANPIVTIAKTWVGGTLGVDELSVIQRLVVLLDRADQRVVEAIRKQLMGWGCFEFLWVFIWFRLLEVIGLTPVADLVTAVISWIPAALSVPLVGIFEVVLGFGLVIGDSLRITLLLLWLHLAGTLPNANQRLLIDITSAFWKYPNRRSRKAVMLPKVPVKTTTTA